MRTELREGDGMHILLALSTISINEGVKTSVCTPGTGEAGMRVDGWRKPCNLIPLFQGGADWSRRKVGDTVKFIGV